MTGYGRGESVLHDRTITVELRAVNNRYLDCSVKIPRLYVFAEETIKSQVQKKVARGKLDVFVTIDSTAADKVAVSLNRPVADGYYAALTQLRDTYDLRDDISVSLLSRFPDVFLVEKEQGDADVIAQDISQVLDLALEDFNAMRAREGAKLAEDVRSKAGNIAALLAQGLSPIDAACCGVWLHGAAGDLCAARLSQQALLPHDTLYDLCLYLAGKGL